MNQTIQNINIKELSSAIAQICEEKGLGKDQVMEVVEDALAAAYKKDYAKRGQIIKAKFDSDKQVAQFFQIKDVVDKTLRIMNKDSKSGSEITTKETEQEDLPYFNPERDILLKNALKIKKDAKLGNEIQISLPPQNKFGRVAAQNAKQVIIQRLREIERIALFNEFKDKENEVLTATVQRVENRNVYLDLGKMVGVLYPKEQVPKENYRQGQRIKVFVEKVDKDARDTTVILSRATPKLVTKLFTLEVPEIFAGTVIIESIAREAGSRSKIAVKSTEEGIDPIGSCVGQKGIRVQAIIDELGGEKIDIIEFNEDPKTYISHALSPAKVKYVEIDKEENSAVATVEPDQLSLAIGKKGQNVRLAAKLTGWKIDVVGDEDKLQNEELTPKNEVAEKTTVTVEEDKKTEEKITTAKKENSDIAQEIEAQNTSKKDKKSEGKKSKPVANKKTKED
jgi:N utilization substance protein A